jgi:hypothetical protein
MTRIEEIEKEYKGYEDYGFMVNSRDYNTLLSLAKKYRDALEDIIANAHEYNVKDVAVAQAALKEG